MNEAELAQQLGRLQGRFDAMEKEVSEIKSKIGPMYDVLMRAQGGWKVMVMGGSICAAIGALVMKGIHLLFPNPGA